MRGGKADIAARPRRREREPEVDPLVHLDVDRARRLHVRRGPRLTGRRLVVWPWLDLYVEQPRGRFGPRGQRHCLFWSMCRPISRTTGSVNSSTCIFSAFASAGVVERDLRARARSSRAACGARSRPPPRRACRASRCAPAARPSARQNPRPRPRANRGSPAALPETMFGSLSHGAGTVSPVTSSTSTLPA